MVDVWIMAPSQTRRDWLLNSMSSEPSIRVAGVAPTFPFLRSLMGETPAELAVIDLQSQRETAIVREWLLELLDDVTPILLLSPEPDPTISSRIRHARIGGLLQSNASSDQIVQSIKLIASGLMVLDNALMPQLVEDEAFVEPLTPRESEVLRLLADGLGNRDIATTLNISEHTIKFHIHSILGKLGATSRTEAVTRGLRSGLIEL